MFISSACFFVQKINFYFMYLIPFTSYRNPVILAYIGILIERLPIYSVVAH